MKKDKNQDLVNKYITMMKKGKDVKDDDTILVSARTTYETAAKIKIIAAENAMSMTEAYNEAFNDFIKKYGK